MATHDLSIRLSLKDADAIKAALRQVGDEGQTALKVIETASDKSTVSSLRFERSLRSLKEGLDPAIRAQREMERSQALLDEALRRGSVSAEDHGRLLGLVSERYKSLDKAAAEAARATEAAADADRQLAAARSAIHEQTKAREAEQWQEFLEREAQTAAQAAEADRQLAAARSSIHEQTKAREAEQWQEFLEREAQTAAQAAEADRQLAAARSAIHAQTKAREAEQWEAMLRQEAEAAEAAADAAEEEAAAIGHLRDQIDPAAAAQRRMAEETEQLARWLAEGKISAEEHASATRMMTASVTWAADGTKLAGHQITNLTYQIQDAAAQLAGGQSPFLILMQQGPQATEAVGGVGNALRLLVSPTGLAVAGLGLFAGAVASVAMRVSDIGAEARHLDVTLRAAGNTAGMTGGQLRDMALAISESGTASRADMLETVGEITKFRQIRGGMVGEVAKLAEDYAAASGQKMAPAAKQLSEALTGNFTAFKSISDQYGLLQPDELEHIQNLTEQGRLTEAMRLQVDALNGRFKGLAELGMSSAGKAMHSLGAAWDGFMEKVARSRFVEEQADWLSNSLKAIIPASDEVKKQADLSLAEYDAYIATLQELKNAARSEAEQAAAEVDIFEAQYRRAEAIRNKKKADAASLAEDQIKLANDADALIKKYDQQAESAQSLANEENKLLKAIGSGAVTMQESEKALNALAYARMKALPTGQQIIAMSADEIDTTLKLTSALGDLTAAEETRAAISALIRKNKEQGVETSQQEIMDVRRKVEVQALLTASLKQADEIRLANATNTADKKLLMEETRFKAELDLVTGNSVAEEAVRLAHFARRAEIEAAASSASITQANATASAQTAAAVSAGESIGASLATGYNAAANAAIQSAKSQIASLQQIANAAVSNYQKVRDSIGAANIYNNTKSSSQGVALHQSYWETQEANIAAGRPSWYGMGIYNEKGNIFSSGNVVPFALGGVPDIVDRPTFFPMANDRTGLMGEAGPEAIMPLTRASNGKLGVQAVGSGQGGTVVDVGGISVSVMVNVPPGSSGSPHQIGTEVARQLAPAIAAEINRQSLSGGPLLKQHAVGGARGRQ